MSPGVDCQLKYNDSSKITDSSAQKTLILHEVHVESVRNVLPPRISERTGREDVDTVQPSPQ